MSLGFAFTQSPARCKYYAGHFVASILLHRGGEEAGGLPVLSQS